MKEERVPLFQLNEEVYIEPTAASPGFHAKVVGLKAKSFLILEYPFAESGSHQIKAQDFVWVRCFETAVFRFKTRVMRVLKEPVGLMFLEYPTSIEEINLRTSERKKIFIRGSFLDLQDRGGRRHWEGYILDISDSGCLMWGDFVHLVDKDILLSFTIPWTGEKIQAKARVVRCEVTDKGIRSGLKFIDLDPETHKRLMGFVSTLKEEELSKIVVNGTPT